MLTKIIKYLVAWRILISLVALLAIYSFPLRPGFSTQSDTFSFLSIFSVWANFDGREFLKLAQFGYPTPIDFSSFIFFPLYPFLIKSLALFGGYLFSALFISHVCLLIGLSYLYKLVSIDLKSKDSLFIVFLILSFPTSFFFGAVYTESLSLMLTILFFYNLRHDRFFLAAIFASLAGATRLLGIFLLIPLLLELYRKENSKLIQLIKSPQILSILIVPIGMIWYLSTKNLGLNELVPIFSFQDKLILPPQILFRYVRMIIFINHSDPLFFTVVLELLTTLLFIALVIVSLFRQRPSYAIYSLIALFIPTLNGTFSSIPRYALLLFPCFVVLGQWLQKQPKWFRAIYFSVCTILGAGSIALFTRGYFIG